MLQTSFFNEVKPFSHDRLRVSSIPCTSGITLSQCIVFEHLYSAFSQYKAFQKRFSLRLVPHNSGTTHPQWKISLHNLTAKRPL